MHAWRLRCSSLLTPSCRYGQSLIQTDPAAERKLRLKCDLAIVPTVSLLYLFCFIDRANLGEKPFHCPRCGCVRRECWTDTNTLCRQR